MDINAAPPLTPPDVPEATDKPDTVPDNAVTVQQPPENWSSMPGITQRPEPTPPDQHSPLEAAHQENIDTDPVMAGRVSSLKRKMPDVPLQFIQKNIVELSKTANSPSPGDLSKYQDEYPISANYLSKTRNMAVAKEDIDNLAGHEDTVRDFSYKSALLFALNPIAYGISQGAGPEAVKELPGTLATGVNEALATGVRAATQSRYYFNKLASGNLAGIKNSAPPEDVLNPGAAKFFEENANFIRPRMTQESPVALAQAGNYGRAGQVLALKVAEGIPSLLPIIFSGGTAGPVYAGVGQAADVNQRAVAAGATPGQAGEDAVLQGLAGGLLMKGGTFGILNNWAKAIEQVSGREGLRQIFTSVGKTFLHSVGLGGGTAALQTWANAAADYYSGVDQKSFENMGSKTLESLAVGAGTGAVLSAPGVVSTVSKGMAGRPLITPETMQAVKKQATETAVTQGRAAWNKLTDLISKNKARKNDPVAHEEFTKSVTEDSPMATVNIPLDAIERFYQDKHEDPAKAMEAIGAKEAWENAQKEGTDLALDTATHWAKLVDSGVAKELTEDIRSAPGLPTPRELEAQKEAESAALKGVSAEAGAPIPKQVEEPKTIEESVQKVYDEVSDAYKAIGEPKSPAKVFSQFFGAMSARLRKAGVDSDPFKLFKENIYKFKGRAGQLFTPQTKFSFTPKEALISKYKALDNAGKAQRYYADPVTGALNERAWRDRQVDPEKPMVLDLGPEGVKFINDRGFHMAGDDLYRAFAQTAMKVAPEVYKVGGDFAIPVKDLDEGNAILEQIRAAMPPEISLNGEVVKGDSFGVTGAVGDTLETARPAHTALRRNLEETKQRSLRGEEPLNFKTIEGKTGPGTIPVPHAVPEHLSQLIAKKPIEEVVKELSAHEKTGLLPYDAYLDLPEKKFKSAIDMDWLKVVNDSFGHEMGDSYLKNFATAAESLAKAHGLFDEMYLVHKSGDEFIFAHDDPQTIHDFMVELADVMQETITTAKNAEGKEFKIQGGTFGAGIGESDAIAESRLKNTKQFRDAESKGQATEPSGGLVAGSEPRGKIEPDANVIQGRSRVDSGDVAGREPSGLRKGVSVASASGSESLTPEAKKQAWQKSPIYQLFSSGKSRMFIKPPEGNLNKSDNGGPVDKYKRLLRDFRDLGVKVSSIKEFGSKTPQGIARSLLDFYRQGDLHDDPFLKKLSADSPEGGKAADAELDDLYDYFQRFRGKNQADYLKDAGQNKLGEFSTERLYQSSKDAPAFYSRLQKTIEQKMGNTATDDQVRGLIKDLSQEERKWSGIDDFLKDNPKPAKKDLLDFLRANQLEVKEITHGNNGWQSWSDEELRDHLKDLSGSTEDLSGDSRSELIRALDEFNDHNEPEPEDSTKFSKYTLPGGENYREVLFQMPGKSGGYEPGKWYQVSSDSGEVFGGPYSSKKEADSDFDPNAGKLVKADDAGRIESKDKPEFKSGHFDEPNVLAHTRLNDRTDAEGKKVLFIEEIQSDWHQKGRKDGYKQNLKPLSSEEEKRWKQLDAKLMAPDGHMDKFTPEERKEFEDLLDRRHDNGKTSLTGLVPDAPFKKTWHEFVLKRLIREAAEKGYDKIAWTTGEQQAERYDLSKQVNSIKAEAAEETPNLHFVDIRLSDGKDINLEVENGKVREGELSGKPLSDVIGKELAEKILSLEPGKVKDFSGTDLKVGGEGMKGFYDKIIPDFLNKFGKKYGAKVEETKVGAGDFNADHIYEGPEYSLDELKKALIESRKDGPDNKVSAFTGKKLQYAFNRTAIENPLRHIIEDIENGESFKASVRANANGDLTEAMGGKLVDDKSKNKPTPVHSLAITPALKEAALSEGFPMFQQGATPGDERGSIDIYKDPESGKTVFEIAFNPKADRSTMFHEPAHSFLRILRDLALRQDAPQDIKDDYASVLKWFGAKDWTGVTRDHEELFARGFEKRIREGRVPVQGNLRRVFDRFRDWLLGIYKKAEELNVEVPDFMKEVYDRMLATDEEIQQAQADMGFSDMPMPGAPPELQEQLTQLRKQARNQAEDALMTQQMDELTKIHQTEKAKQEEKAREYATKQVDQMPIEIARKAVESLKNQREREAELETQAENMGLENGKAVEEALKAWTPDARESQIKSFTEEAMKASADLKDNPDKIREAALKELHSQHMTEVIALEGEILKELMDRQGITGASQSGLGASTPGQLPAIKARAIASKRAQAQIEARIAKEQAKAVLERMPWKDATNFRKYITQQKNAAFRKGKAIEKGDSRAALKANREQVYNHALAAQALRNKVTSEKAIKRLTDLSKDLPNFKNVPYAFTRQVDQLLQRFGFKQPQEEQTQALLATAMEMQQKGEHPADIANATGYIVDAKGVMHQETLPEFVNRVNDDIHAVSIPPDILAGYQRTLAGVSMLDLVDLKETANQILNLGNAYNRYLSLVTNVNIRESASEMYKRAQQSVGVKKMVNGIETIEMPRGKELLPGHESASNFKAFAERLSDTPDGIAVPWLVNVLTLTDLLDGGKVGPWHDYLYRNLKHAEDNKMVRIEKAKEDVNKLLTAHYTEDELGRYKDLNLGVKIDAFGRVFTRAERLAWMLNMGNEGNRDRLRNTLKTDDAGIMAAIHDPKWGDVKDQERDWKFSQSIWTYLHTYWPDILKNEMTCRGVEAKSVDPTPIETPFGKFDGGYWPIEYDAQKSADAFTNQEQQTALYKMTSAVAAHTDRGHTENRVRTVNRALKLDPMNILFNHIENVVHDIAFRPAIIDTARLLRQKQTKQALVETFGVKGFKAVDNWLKYVASDQRQNLTDVDRVLRWFRYKVTASMLGFKIANFPMDITSNLANSIHAIGLDNTGKMIKNYFTNKGYIDEQVNALSPRMKHRATMRDKTLNDMNQRWEGKDSWIKAHALYLSNESDTAISRPLWWQVRQQALADKYDPQTAIDMADEAITRSIGSGSMLDLSGGQMGGEKMQAVAMLGSWSGMMFNKAWIAGKFAGLEYNRGNIKHAVAISAGALFMLWGVQATNENLWRELFRHGKKGTDKDMGKRIASRYFQQPFSYVFGLRDVVPPLINAALGIHGPGGSSFNFSPMEQSLDNIIRTVGSGFNILFDNHKHFDQKYAERFSQGMGTFVPGGNQINAWAFNFIDYLQGSEADWRDLITRKVKK